MSFESVNIICFANYCRSPVAEYILKNKFENMKISSSGIAPLPKFEMDPRSKDFLLRNNYKINVHNPKKINEKILTEYELHLALDVHVLQMLNTNFPKFRKKIKLLTFQENNTLLPDPFKFNNEDYEIIMKRIENICKSIDFS